MTYFLMGVAYTLLAATTATIFGEQILIQKMEKELDEERKGERDDETHS